MTDFAGTARVVDISAVFLHYNGVTRAESVTSPVLDMQTVESTICESILEMHHDIDAGFGLSEVTCSVRELPPEEVKSQRPDLDYASDEVFPILTVIVTFVRPCGQLFDVCSSTVVPKDSFRPAFLREILIEMRRRVGCACAIVGVKSIEAPSDTLRRPDGTCLHASGEPKSFNPDKVSSWIGRKVRITDEGLKGTVGEEGTVLAVDDTPQQPSAWLRVREDRDYPSYRSVNLCWVKDVETNEDGPNWGSA